MKRKGKILLILCIIAIICVGILYYISPKNKDHIDGYISNRNQEIYILGTIHSNHFEKKYDYSMADIINCIKNVKPDVVFIESREETHNRFGVIDGPIDMIASYSYCKENNIPIEMIDWWELNNEATPGTTTIERDDNIYVNIVEKLGLTKENDKVMIICGDTHRQEQGKRFIKNGFKEMNIKNKNQYFESSEKEFVYPELMKKTIEDKVSYEKNEFQKDIDDNITDEKNNKLWHENADALVNTLNFQLDRYINKNLLY